MPDEGWRVKPDLTITKDTSVVECTYCPRACNCKYCRQYHFDYLNSQED